MAAAETSVAAMATANVLDRSSGDEKEDEQEDEGGTGTRRARPAPLDIAEAQNAAAAAGPTTPSSATPKTPRPLTRYDKERKLGHRRVDEEGQITYKKIQTTQIMGSIQLGISHAVGGLASKPERDVLMQDFAVVETTTFPGQGSNITPAHHYTDFRFKTYAPVAFRYFRDLFGIQPDDFLLSMCNEPMRELTNPGASGSIFYVTCDDEFIIKTVQHKEGEFLQKLLPGYYMNLNQNPRTLLPKFFGLYCYQCGGKNIRLAVMNNLLPSSIKIHQKYDLKGSTYKRKANKHERSKPSPTFKDLDFMEHHSEGILLEAETYTALVKTIQRDCRVLASFKIMDYSLLVGIHNLDRAHKERLEARRAAKSSSDPNSLPPGTSEADGAGSSGLARSRSINRQRLVAHSTAMEAIQADCEVIDEEEDVPPGGIPARNSKGERLLIYLGIIDILQSYRLKKKLEHTWKAMLHDGDTVSVHRPGFYAQRFQDFMATTVFKKIPSPLKHSPSRKKSLSMRHRPPSGSEEARLEERNAVVVARDLAAYGVGSGVSRVVSDQAGSLSWSPRPVFDTVASVASDRPSVPVSTVVNFKGPSDRISSVSASSRTVRMSSTGIVILSSRGGSGLAVSARPRSKVPPPVPPRSPRKTRFNDYSGSLSHSDIPVSFTPTPSFDDTLSDTSELKSKIRSSTDPSEDCRAGSHERIRTVHEHSDVISISQITLKTESLLSTHSESGSTTSSGFSSIVKTCTWTPPHSVEGSTPTHTEGTPSFTESSSSGDLGCPTTPVKSLSRSEQHGVIKTTRTVLTASTTRIDDSDSGGPIKSYQETEMTRL